VRDRRGWADSGSVDESMKNPAIFDSGVLDLRVFDDAVSNLTIGSHALIQNGGAYSRVNDDTIYQENIFPNVALVQNRVFENSAVQFGVQQIVVYIDGPDHELPPDPMAIFEVNLAWHDCPVHVCQDPEKVSRGCDVGGVTGGS
jgi:hypothetical protein